LDTKRDSYENRDELHGVIPSHHFEFIKTVNDSTANHFIEEWSNNIKKNKRFWRKHKKLRDLTGLGRGKAVIGIGAGGSFNKNKDVLKHFVTSGVGKSFITIAANHQLKPLLEMGVVPDYVLLVDSSDVVMDQLTKDIPEEASRTQLITGAYANPKVIKEWDKQGRGVVFFTPAIAWGREIAKKYLKRGYVDHEIELGGNVLNAALMIGCGVLQSSVFMGVGNDLSFGLNDDLDKQRKGYYADGDYSTNIGTGQDEGVSDKRWLGFSMERKGTKHYSFTLNKVGVSETLWAYKVWLECTMMGLTKEPIYLNYFNCTEGGVLGVMAKEEGDKALADPNNWYFLDSVCINEHTEKPMYMTTMLEDAINMCLEGKQR